LLETLQSFNLGQGNLGPYDVGVRFTSPPDQVQLATFVITSPVTDLNAEELLENTNWYVRLQETSGIDIETGETVNPGDGSAKTGGLIVDLPACGEEPPGENGVANTPGFWKQTRHFQYWEQPYDPTDSFTGTFGVNVAPTGVPDTLLGALSAGGGGVNALGRAGTAALLNAASDEAGSGINYIIDNEALAISVLEVGTDLTSVLTTLDKIDLNQDGIIGSLEVKGAVNDALTDGGLFNGKGGIQAVALAFDAMNNMPSLDVSMF
jgi:hypothetical protein